MTTFLPLSKFHTSFGMLTPFFVLFIICSCLSWFRRDGTDYLVTGCHDPIPKVISMDTKKVVAKCTGHSGKFA